MKRCLLLTVLIIGPVLVLCGCNSFPSEHDPVVQSVYRLEGLLVADPNKPSTVVAIQTRRNDSIMMTGLVKFGSDTLVFDSCTCTLSLVFGRSVDSATAYTAGQYQISFQDSSLFSHSDSTILADTFSIISIIPEHPIPLVGFDPVILEWSIATGVEKYVLVTTPRDSTYTGYGVSKYAAQVGDVILFDAFIPPDSTNPDTGWHYVYIYALTGAPDSAMASKLLPVPLPDQRPDNINSGDLAGRFGTVTVTFRDSVLVAYQE